MRQAILPLALGILVGSLDATAATSVVRRPSAPRVGQARTLQRIQSAVAHYDELARLMADPSQHLGLTMLADLHAAAGPARTSLVLTGRAGEHLELATKLEIDQERSAWKVGRGTITVAMREAWERAHWPLVYTVRGGVRRRATAADLARHGMRAPSDLDAVVSAKLLEEARRIGIAGVGQARSPEAVRAAVGKHVAAAEQVRRAVFASRAETQRLADHQAAMHARGIAGEPWVVLASDSSMKIAVRIESHWRGQRPRVVAIDAVGERDVSPADLARFGVTGVDAWQRLLAHATVRQAGLRSTTPQAWPTLPLLERATRRIEHDLADTEALKEAITHATPALKRLFDTLPPPAAPGAPLGAIPLAHQAGSILTVSTQVTRAPVSQAELKVPGNPALGGATLADLARFGIHGPADLERVALDAADASLAAAGIQPGRRPAQSNAMHEALRYANFTGLQGRGEPDLMLLVAHAYARDRKTKLLPLVERDGATLAMMVHGGRHKLHLGRAGFFQVLRPGEAPRGLRADELADFGLHAVADVRRLIDKKLVEVASIPGDARDPKVVAAARTEIARETRARERLVADLASSPDAILLEEHHRTGQLDVGDEALARFGPAVLARGPAGLITRTADRVHMLSPEDVADLKVHQNGTGTLQWHTDRIHYGDSWDALPSFADLERMGMGSPSALHSRLAERVLEEAGMPGAPLSRKNLARARQILRADVADAVGLAAALRDPPADVERLRRVVDSMTLESGGARSSLHLAGPVGAGLSYVVDSVPGFRVDGGPATVAALRKLGIRSRAQLDEAIAAAHMAHLAPEDFW